MIVLEALLTRMGWRQIFRLPEKMRQCVATALHHPKLYVDKVENIGEPSNGLAQYSTCNTAITFTYDDLLLGSKPHNRPLFVTGYIREQKVKRILIDGGSSVNIMPKSTMNELGLTVDCLLYTSPSPRDGLLSRMPSSA